MPAVSPRPIQQYYHDLHSVTRLGATNEGAIRSAFQQLLTETGRAWGLTVVAEQTQRIAGTRQSLRFDGELRDTLNMRRGIWEAKDSSDDLEREIAAKIRRGYPTNNILFEDSQRGVLYQNGVRVLDVDLTDSAKLTRLLEQFFSHSEPQIEEFHQAVARFRREIPSLAQKLDQIIERERRENPRFESAFNDFVAICRSALNPQTSDDQVEEMLIQHLLTERIFRSVFNNPDFVRRNAIALELEKVISVLTSRSFSRDLFLQSLDYFYRAIEDAARTISDYSEKSTFLNTVYEQFFQAYSTNTADTHGIVYTPAPIVRWMVASVEQALQREFNLSLSDQGVHVLDPCVGTGTFMLEIIEQISSSMLAHKYQHELHCNEVLLLPYYIAAQNIEHEYFVRMQRYESFEGIVFADTLEMQAGHHQPSFFAPENTQRVNKQQDAPIFVVIGNPPYNVGQENENDNNKNRKYPHVDARIRQTYSKASKATLQTKLYDMYVRFFRWATDRLGDRDGMVAFVSNGSFLDQIAFDGMRKELAKDFTSIYVLDLGGNVRKNPKLSGTTHNVFGIQVSVAITLLIRNRAKHETNHATIRYARVDEWWRKEQKYNFLNESPNYTTLDWQMLTPNSKGTWLTDGLHDDFDEFVPLGSKESKSNVAGAQPTIFGTYSLGVSTNRDTWVYDFDRHALAQRMQHFIATYNAEVDRWNRSAKSQSLDDFLLQDDTKIKWSEFLKNQLKRLKYIEFDQNGIVSSLYRPFTRQFLAYQHDILDRPASFNQIFANKDKENRVICVSGTGSLKLFHTLMSSRIVGLDFLEKTQCFPFYVYDEDGSNRRENISDWALAEFQARVMTSPPAPLHRRGEGSSGHAESQDQHPNLDSRSAHVGEGDVGHAESQNPTPTPDSQLPITKWDIFHYIYGILHSPQYRTRYAANLKLELPRIPIVAHDDFWRFVAAGKELAELHVNYEQQAQYRLRHVENRNVPWTWRVEKMRLSKDKTAIIYNECLTLDGIPAAVFDYKLGNRSALEWVIDQYQVSTDKRSGIVSDPNNAADPEYIVRLIKHVITVSLRTVDIVAGLPALEHRT